MKFNDEKKVIIESMSKEEAKAFLEFLTDERERHVFAMDEAKHWATNPSSNVSLREFYQTAEMRHQEDVEDIDRIVSKVKEMYGL